MPNPAAPRLIRLPEVQARTGLSRSHLYALEALGEFPRRLKLSIRATAWSEAEVFAWIKSRIAARDAKRAA